MTKIHNYKTKINRKYKPKANKIKNKTINYRGGEVTDMERGFLKSFFDGTNSNLLFDQNPDYVRNSNFVFIGSTLNFNVVFPTINLTKIILQSLKYFYQGMRGVSINLTDDFLTSINDEFEKINIIDVLSKIRNKQSIGDNYDQVTLKEYLKTIIVGIKPELLEYVTFVLAKIIYQIVRERGTNFIYTIGLDLPQPNPIVTKPEQNKSGVWSLFNNNTSAQTNPTEQKIIQLEISSDNLFEKEDVIYSYHKLLDKIDFIYELLNREKPENQKKLSNTQLIYIAANMLFSFEEFQFFIHSLANKLSFNYVSTFEPVTREFVKAYLDNYNYTINSLVPNPIIELPGKKLSELVNKQIILIEIINNDLIIKIYALFFLYINPDVTVNGENITTKVNDKFPFIIAVAICKKTINITKNTYDFSFDYYWLINTQSRIAFKEVIEYNIKGQNDVLTNQILGVIEAELEDNIERLEQQRSSMGATNELETELITYKYQKGLITPQKNELNRLSTNINYLYIKDRITEYLKKFEYIFKESIDPNYVVESFIEEKRVKLQQLNNLLISLGHKEELIDIYKNIYDFWLFSSILHNIAPLRSSAFSTTIKGTIGENVGDFSTKKIYTLYNERVYKAIADEEERIKNQKIELKKRLDELDKEERDFRETDMAFSEYSVNEEGVKTKQLGNIFKPTKLRGNQPPIYNVPIDNDPINNGDYNRYYGTINKQINPPEYQKQIQPEYQQQQIQPEYQTTDSNHVELGGKRRTKRRIKKTIKTKRKRTNTKNNK